MKIVNISTQNKLITRNMIVRKAIRENMQYVEMDTEVLVEDTLYRINEESEINTIIEVLNNNYQKEPIFVIGKPDIESKDLKLSMKPNKKADLKRNSRLVKTKLNKNGFYKKRGK